MIGPMTVRYEVHPVTPQERLLNKAAEQLAAGTVNIDSSGASKIAVNAKDEIHTQASGASRITYTGDPKTVENQTSGSSSITKK